MLSRKVVTRRGRGFRGYFPSRKLGRMVAYESLLESWAILLLEYSSGTLFFREQPELVHYVDGDTVRDYYPDFEVTLDDGRLVHLEIKANAQLQKPRIAAKYSAIAAHYQNEGREFRIATEDDICRQPLLSNARMLAYLARHACAEGLMAPLEAMFVAGELPFQFVEQALGRECLLRLLAVGRLYCDLTRPLAGDNPVGLTRGGCHATYLL